ncbi:hypothetical protein H0H93_006555 [Arthromyces matolae]|nr:hypothetical protein H0H93_006555 [Arthromyces matolae]
MQISWAPNVSSRAGVATGSRVDDNQPAFQFQGEWATSGYNYSGFYGHNGHTTTSQGSSFDFKFTSVAPDLLIPELQVDAVTLYGSVGPDHGLYSVQLDDQATQTFQATQMTPATQVALYYVSHLASGNHTIHVTNEENATFDIDWANIDTVSNIAVTGSGTTASVEPTKASNAQVPKRLAAGTIGAIAVGVFIVLLLGILALLFYIRATKKNAEMKRAKFDARQAVFEGTTSVLKAKTL